MSQKYLWYDYTYIQLNESWNKLNNILLRAAHVGDKTSRKIIIRKVKMEFASRENEQVLLGGF